MDATTFMALWDSWGPLLASVLGGMTVIIVVLVRGYREREKEIRDLHDAAGRRELAANERYITLINTVLDALTAQREAQRRLVEALDALREGMRIEDRMAGIDSKVATALERLGRGGNG